MAGVALVVAGLILRGSGDNDQVADAMVGVGAVLVPGLAGKVIKDATTLRPTA